MSRETVIAERLEIINSLSDTYTERTGIPARDNLTGLYRSSVLHSLLEHVLLDAESRDKEVTVAMLDLDRLRDANRRLGRALGDVHMKEVAAALTSCIRADDIGGWHQGRYIAVLRDATGVQGLSAVDRVRAAAEFRLDDEVAISAGIASAKGGTTNAARLISNAEAALNDAKMRGSNSAGIYSPDLEDAPSDRFTIMVVDDDDRNRKLVRAMLDEPEYAVVEAGSGEEALGQLRRGGVDLVISDLRMPGMNGIELCARVKASESTRMVPFVIVTAYADAEQRVRGIEVGADDFLSKPIDSTELHARVRSLLRIRRMNRESTSIESVLFTLINAIEAKDSYTQGHTERVATLATEIGRRIGLPGSSISALRIGGILHDIGKIGISGSILNKAGPLTPEEWTIMQSHTELGFRICLPLTRNLGTALDIIRHHHEKLDGSSYPDGLSGSQIPIETRIMCVADIYDALTSDRPYRRALSRQEAIRILREDAEGGRIDGTVLEQLEAIIRAEDGTQKRANDPADVRAKSVLVVEDDQLNMKLVRTLLKLEGYRVLEAVDAETGILAAREERPDLVLMDIQLPGMDGITAAGVLREHEGLHDVPIVGLSSFAMESEIRRAMESGFDDYVTKPIDTAMLPVVVKRYVSQ